MKDDVISRQAAIDEIRKCRFVVDAIERIKGLPSVQLERKTGKWIRKSPTAWSWTCSCCKRDNAYAYSAGKYYEPDVLQDSFCPNCGADMRGDEKHDD